MESLFNFLALGPYVLPYSLKYTIFVHVHGVRSGRFSLRAGVDLPRPQFTRVVHHLSFLLLGLRSGHRSEGGRKGTGDAEWQIFTESSNNFSGLYIFEKGGIAYCYTI